jgi:hypothetical protein
MLRNPSAAGYNTSSAAIITVPQGGMYPDGQAPTQKRPAMPTRDFGVNRTAVRTRNSSTSYDFGQRLAQKTNLAIDPDTIQYSEDGRFPIQPRGNPLAIQKTNDLYGTPMLSNTNGGLTPLTTIAPY